MSEPHSRPRSGEIEERLQAARRADRLAPELVNLLAFFASAPLPVEEISRFADRVPGRLSTAEASPERIVRVLRSLVEEGALRETEAGVVMPSELQAIIRDDLVRPQAAGYADAALRILEGMDEAAGESPSGDQDLLRREVILFHAPAVAERLADLGRAPDRALVLAARAVEAAGTDSDRALEVAEEVVETARRSRRLRDPFLVAALLDQLGELRASRGRDEEAQAALRDSVRRVREACPPDDPRRAVVLHNAGDLSRRIGRPEQAAELLRESLELLRSDALEEGSDALRARTQLDLAEALLAAGAFGEAGPAARAAVRVCRRRLGAGHPETAAAWSLWGRALRGQGAHPEATACFRRAIAALEETYGEEHPALGPDLGNLAETLAELGQAEIARGIHGRAREIFREAYGPDHRLTRAAEHRMNEL